MLSRLFFMPFLSRLLLPILAVKGQINMSKCSMNFTPGKKKCWCHFFFFFCRTPHFASDFFVSFLSFLVEEEADSFPLYREVKKNLLVKNTTLYEKTHMTPQFLNFINKALCGNSFGVVSPVATI